MQKRTIFFLFSLMVFSITACDSDNDDPTPVSGVAPTALAYSPNSYTVVAGSAGSSAVPTITGTTPITYALVGNSEGTISINSSTGVISSTDALAEGTYNLSVEASNDFGEQTFTNAFSISVTSSATAPTNLSYTTSSITVRKHETKSTGAASVTGTGPITFAIDNAATLPASITIDAATGEVQVAKDLAHGSYSVDVKASNSVGETTVKGAVTITSEEVLFSGTDGIKTFFETKCTPCHVDGGSRPNWTVHGTASANITNIISRVVAGTMPQGGPALTQEQIDFIKQWEADGLKE